MFNKLRDFLGLNEAEEYEEYYDEEMEQDNYQNLYQEQNPPLAEEERPARHRPTRERTHLTSEASMTSVTSTTSTPATSTRSNVIGMPGVTNGVSEVIVFEPRSFEEMPQVIQALRERRSVVLNLNIMDPDEAQRAVDFVAGGTYAIDGHQERIGESIFLFTPSCVQVTTQSGIVHEAPMPAKSATRQASPAPTWSNDMGQQQMAQ